MNDLEFVKVNHARHDLGELRVVDEWEKGDRGDGGRAHQSQTVRLWV